MPILFVSVTLETFSTVNSLAMIALQPSVPNLILVMVFDLRLIKYFNVEIQI